MKQVFKNSGVFLVLQGDQFYAFSQGISIVQEDQKYIALWYDALDDRLHSWTLAKPAATSDREVIIQPQTGPELRFVYIDKSVYDSYIRKRAILTAEAAPQFDSDEAVQRHMLSVTAYR